MIRKSITHILYISLALVMLASCSPDDDVLTPSTGQPHAVKVSMQVGVSGGVVSRDLTTWDGAQQVNDMRIYVFRCPKDKKNTTEETFTYYVPDDLKDRKSVV